MYLLGYLIGKNNWENQQNKNTNSKSGVPGVTWESRSDRWIVKITVKGKRKYLGQFINLEDACKVRKAAEIEYASDLGTL